MTDQIPDTPKASSGEDSESEKRTSSGILASRTNRVLGLAGALLGVFVLVVQIAGVAFDTFILAGGIVLALVGLAVLPWQSAHNLRIALGLLAACIGAAAITTVALQKPTGAAEAKEQRASGKAQVIFQFPLKSHSGGPVDMHRCMTFAGTVRNPGTGVKVLIATKGASPTYFFKLADKQPDSQGAWYGEKTIGLTDQPGLYNVYALLVDASTGERLSQEKSGSDLPAGIQAQDQLMVIRKSGAEPACGEKYVLPSAPAR